jgi:predicted phage baseplate assembly protein
MPLPTAKLDDRRFQDIVDEAKLLIPHFCPEWTDHNVSDPGVAMIELFAWMTDMLLYRVNQIPDKMYVHFLDLIGLKLGPPRAAHADVTFYLSAPQPGEIIIPADTEVATVRTETTPAIIFTTEKDLTIRPPDVRGLFTRGRSSSTTVPVVSTARGRLFCAHPQWLRGNFNACKATGCVAISPMLKGAQMRTGSPRT